MYITVYVDPEDQRIFVYKAEVQPVVPEEYLSHCNLAVFNTDEEYPDDKKVISRASVLEVVEIDPSFGDDSKTVELGPHNELGRSLKPIFISHEEGLC